MQCIDGSWCPASSVCDEVHHTCVRPDQLTSCVGIVDGERCSIGELTDVGECRDMVCVEQRCGDGLVTHTETCDGSDTIPNEGTCVDFAYDYGVLGCTELCNGSSTSCHTIGWHFRAVPGGGGITAIWEDGDQLWLANQLGVQHYDGKAWTDPEIVTGAYWQVHGIWARGGQVFAVGWRGADGVIAHYDGSTWTETAATNRLFAVWGRSPIDVYAVGAAGLILHYDGSAWSPMAVPGMTDDLRAVTGWATGVVAVGKAGTILRYAGSWSALQSNIGAAVLEGVWGTGPTNFYAVGADTMNDLDPLNDVGLMYASDGAAVQEITPTISPPFRAIHGRSPTEIYVTGDEGTILLGNGAQWQAMESPTKQRLQSVHAGASKVYAAFQTQFFIEYEGAAWLRSVAGNLPTTVIRGLWGPNREIQFALGDGCNIHEFGTSTLADGTWQLKPYPTCGMTTCPTNFNFMISLWGSGPGDVYAGGPYGRFFHRTSTQWECVTPGPLGDSKWTSAIWGTGPGDVFAAGGLGDGSEVGLAHFNGVTWEDWSTRVTAYFKGIRGIWGNAPNNVFFVGNDGAIVHYDGTTFTPMTSGVSADLMDVWGSGDSDIFAVGEGGTIVHYDGTQWQRQLVPTSAIVSTDSMLFDVEGTGSSDVFAIGGRTLLHYNGTAWAPVVRPAADGALVLRYLSDELHIGGDNGIAPHLVGRLLP